MFKRYIIKQTADLDLIDQWVLDPDHRSQIVFRNINGTREYILIVEDASGLPPVSPLAEKELADHITETEWPE